MRLSDTNVLVYAVNEDAPQHERARRWIEAAFADDRGVGFAWVCLLGFLRLSTCSGILREPLKMETALGVVRDWIEQARARVVQPGGRHADLLGRLLIGAGAGSSLVTDAHLAALAIEHGAQLASFDRDFQRFAGLQFEWLSDRGHGD